MLRRWGITNVAPSVFHLWQLLGTLHCCYLCWNSENVWYGKVYCGHEKSHRTGCKVWYGDMQADEYIQAINQVWCWKHCCNFHSGSVRAGKQQVTVKDESIHQPCFMKNYTVKYPRCHSALDPEGEEVICNKVNCSVFKGRPVLLLHQGL